MAQLLQHQESAVYGKELNGSGWGILQFFGFRRRLRSTKMLADKKHGHGKGSGGSRRRNSYAPLKNEDSGISMDKEKSDELKVLDSKKIIWKEGQKEKMLPVAPKLLRTISIHYLESNEYVLDGEATSSVDGSSHGSTMSMQDATNKDLQHARSDIVGGSDNTSLILSLKGDNNNVKRKSHRSISMDGVFHKVPYGKKVSDDVIGEALPRSASATYDRDGQKSYIGIAAKRHVNQGFQRSRSLTESLESYSRLLDSIANSESKRTLTSSKSTRHHSLDGPNMMSSLPRTSNTDVRSQGLKRHDETPEDALESHENDDEKTNVHRDKEVGMDEIPNDETADGSENHFPPEECISDKKSDVAVSTEAHSCTDPSPSEIVDISEAHAATCDDNDQGYSPVEVDLCDSRSTPEEANTLDQHAAICDNDDEIQSSKQADSYILSSEDATFAEEHTTHSDDNQTHSFQTSEPIEGTFCVPDPGQEFEADINLSYEQETESPVSVLDVAFLDDPANLVKHMKLDDTLLKPKILHLNDIDVSTDTGVVQGNNFGDISDLKVDPAHKHEFNYVKGIFKKSSFLNEILYDEWYSQNITALQEEDCQHYEAAAAAFDFTDMSAEQLLLFDLTNEALLDIYKKYSVFKSKVSWFSSFDRPKPVGRLVLKELWSKVSCQLDEQPQSSIEVDTILSSDLAKGDRWINFQRGADNLRNNLGDFVFDRLLTELVLELAEF
ncbi:hypothetical protein PR202_ga23474 [Eleusine coracana subsp. coracana]|uniref:DUF4378 domain-containing protein n=1 Tax=Eleusine coracana subsp. coracana TaxID=191504 RepID=A0AAV5D6B7_ELECO|nr:hypothetical protein PR202_ga23474 [Eleusine coracana subsp. coracana]